MVYITPARNVGARIVGVRIFILLLCFFNCLVYITSVSGGIPGFYINSSVFLNYLVYITSVPGEIPGYYIKFSVFLNYLVYITLVMVGGAGRIGSALMKYLFMKYLLDHQLREDGFFVALLLRMTEEVLS